MPDELDARAPGMGASDAILVFGTRLERPAEVAAELFHAGIARLIVLTGGPSRQADGRSEARHHEAILLGMAVQPDAILVDDRSSHTGENVDFALALMGSHGIVPRTVAVVAKAHHRRALITLADRSPLTDTIFAATYELPLTDERRSKELDYFSDFMRRGIDPLVRTSAGWRRTSPHGSAQ